MNKKAELGAALLAQAWSHGRQLTELPIEVRPQTLAEGYDLQDALVAFKGGAVGWKLGVGSKAAMHAAKIERPLVGRVVQGHVHPAGAVVRLPNSAPVTVEFEIAFLLGRDITPEDSLADPMTAVESMCVTFELVLSRFVDRRAVGWPSFVGDSVGFEALVVGGEIKDIAGVGKSVVIEVDGIEAARGLTGDDLTDPETSFSHLIAHARERGMTLRKGEIVTLGAIGKPFDVAGSGEIVARYLDSDLQISLLRANTA